MNAQEVVDAANTSVSGDREPLPMNESSPACNKRFVGLGIPEPEFK